MVRRVVQSALIVAASLLAVGGCRNSALHTPAPTPDRNGCCSPDPVMSSCMDLGGYSPQGCGSTCDFYCSTNWRIENDNHGCPTWRYDTRAPLPGETSICFPDHGAGSGGAQGVGGSGAGGAGGTAGAGAGSGSGGSAVGGSSGAGGNGTGGNGVGGNGAGGNGAGGGLGWPTRQPDANGCCAPDSTRSGCMFLGGAAPEGCYFICDFFCSTNWRIEDDSHGCPTWRYDLRSPGPGEDPGCFPRPDAGSGTNDAGSDAVDARADE